MAVSSKPRKNKSGTEKQYFGVFERRLQCFGVAIDYMSQIADGRNQTISEVPRSGQNLAGVLNLEGEVLPVLLPDIWLGLPFEPYHPEKPIVVLRSHDAHIGFQVDVVHSVVSLSVDSIFPHPLSHSVSYFKGVTYEDGGRTIALLDIEGLLKVMYKQITFGI